MKPGPRYNPDVHYVVKSALFDVDNTLVGNESRDLPSERSKSAVMSTQGKVKIGLATARPLAQVEHILRCIGTEGLSLLCNGAQIINNATRQVVAEWTINPEISYAITRYAQSLEIPYWINDNGEDFFPSQAGRNTYEKRLNIWDHGSARLPASNFSFSKTFVIVLHNITETQILQAAVFVERYVGSDIALLVGHETIQTNGAKVYDVFVTHKLANKKDAFYYIASAQGLEVSEIMVIGDGMNDAELIREAGVGVAMGNSAQETLDAATFITADWQHDGAAVALEYAINGVSSWQ